MFLYTFCTKTMLLRLLTTSATLWNQQPVRLQKPVKFEVRIHAGEPAFIKPFFAPAPQLLPPAG
jgi:hypothetical protein